MFNPKAEPCAHKFGNGPTIRLEGTLYSWREVDPERLATYEALAMAADQAHRLSRELQRRADEQVALTRKRWAETR